ncbi:hypothetical protein DSL72_002523 [Monilinia vaccinii-corymbosi]|uniref:Uncharacterized protein n=1 Tax=Monilinia vaccinii-corymbosi TaxID=61207 RepID=A0A8A3PCW4_9HELO|nr:hypothetical protein DSL72_002523 [Monilinia vaccinii-corymbosi]
MAHSPSFRWHETVSPPESQSRTPRPSNAPHFRSQTGHISEWDEETHSNSSSDLSQPEPHPPGKSVPSHNAKPTWNSVPHPWPSQATFPDEARTPNPSHPPARPEDRDYSAPWDPDMQTPPPLGTAGSRPHASGRETPNHEFTTTWTPIKHHLSSPTHSRTLHPSELPLRRHDLIYSAAWDSNEATPSVRIPATHLDDFSGARGSREPRRSSGAASAEDQGCAYQQGGEEDDGPTSPDPGARDSTDDTYPSGQRGRSTRDPLRTPPNPPSPSPTNRSRTPSSESPCPSSSESLPDDDRRPAQRATDKLWGRMYARGDAAMQEDRGLMSKGPGDIEERKLGPR